MRTDERIAKMETDHIAEVERAMDPGNLEGMNNENDRLRARVADQTNELFTAHDAITRLRARVAELEAPWRNADSHDWDFLLRSLGDGGQGSFWRAVLTEVRAVLAKGRAA